MAKITVRQLAVGIWGQEIQLLAILQGEDIRRIGSRIGRINSRFLSPLATDDRQLVTVRNSVLLAPLQGASSQWGDSRR